MITITYFGVLKEQLGVAEEVVAWSAGSSSALIDFLRARDATWFELLAPDKIFRVVVNETICYEPVEVRAGDRVALLPPVTGG